MPSARCRPVPLSPICAPVTSGSPSRKPVVEAAPPVHCATFSYTLQSSYGPGPKPLIEATIIFGLRLWIFSQGKPMRSSTPGPKCSTSTSQLLISAVRTSLPFGFLVSSVIERLLWLSMVKYRLSTFGTSCNWPRVISPTPGRSTLITSAPTHASICVQVGPDWTCVKSRMRTPFSAFVICYLSLIRCLSSCPRKRASSNHRRFSGARPWSHDGSAVTGFPACAGNDADGLSVSLFAKFALRIEVADAAALAAGCRIDRRVDQGRLAGIHRRVHGALQIVRRRDVNADAAKGLHHLVIARTLDEDGGCHVRTAGRIDVGAAIDAVIVEDDDADRQVVAADRLDLHAGETKRAVAFDREHGLAGLDRGGDGKAHADAHDAPGSDVEALARLIHVDDAAGEIERVGAFVDQDGVGPLLDDAPERAQGAVIVHRRCIVHQPRRHLGDVLVSLALDRAGPFGGRGGPVAAHVLEQRRYTGADVADHWGCDLDIGVHLLGLDVDLDELLRGLAPALAFAVRQQPVEARADQHHDVGVLQHRRARGAGALRMGVGQQAL